MPPTMRSAAKAAKEAIKAEQKPGPDNNSISGTDNNEATPSVEPKSEPGGTPVKGTPGSVTKSGRKRKGTDVAWPWTHHRPSAAEVALHTRTAGRNLIPWQRARMAEKLLLNMEYECTRQGIAIPWEDIAHRFHPGATAAGVQQHLARLRPVLAAEGHMIPPKLPTKKDRALVDSTIRGYVREHIDENGAINARPIKYTDPYEHPVFSRADAYDLNPPEDNEDDDSKPPLKMPKLESPEGTQPGTASKGPKNRRRTRVPIKYGDAEVSDHDDDQNVDSEVDEGDTVRGDNNNEDKLKSRISQPRDNVAPADVIMNPYPPSRVLGNHPQTEYSVHGKPMTLGKVSATAVEPQQPYGYKDPQYAHVLTDWERNSQALAHQLNSINPMMNARPMHWPGAGFAEGGNMMTPFQGNTSPGTNNGIAQYQQPVRHTPVGTAKADLGGFAVPQCTLAGAMGLASGVKMEYNSPASFNPGGRMSSYNDYKTPVKFNPIQGMANYDMSMNPFDDNTVNANYPAAFGHGFGMAGSASGNNNMGFDIAAQPRHLTPSEIKAEAESGSGTTGGAGNNDQGFDVSAYLRHLTASQVNAEADSGSANPAGANNDHTFSNYFLSPDPSAPAAGSPGTAAGSTGIAGPSSSEPTPAPLAEDFLNLEYGDPFMQMPSGDPFVQTSAGEESDSESDK